MTLFKRICNGAFAFPNPKKHGMEVKPEAKALIKGLLNKNAEERTGSSISLGDEVHTEHKIPCLFILTHTLYVCFTQ